MSLIKPYEPYFDAPHQCHVCSAHVALDDVAVVHDGYVRARYQDEDYGSIVLHTWCATVLAMRLIYDAMSNERSVDTPQRPIERLRRD